MSDIKQELYLSPADLAESLGLSVSTLKRWADKGVLSVERTAGGHRRIAMTEALRFIRESGMKPVLPGRLGLGKEASTGTASASAERFAALLHEGRSEEARKLIVSAFVMGEAPSLLGDLWIRPACTRVGELWKHGDAGVAFEHQATDAIVRAISEMRARVEPPPGAPIAIGGAVAGDPYVIPSALVALVLAVHGFQTINFGPDLPPAALVAAVDKHKPKVTWLSASVVDMESADRASLDILGTKLARKTRLVVGGRAAPSRVHGAVVLPDLAGLAAFARGVTSND